MCSGPDVPLCTNIIQLHQWKLRYYMLKCVLVLVSCPCHPVAPVEAETLHETGLALRASTFIKVMATLNTTSAVGPGGENVTLALYSSSCCLPVVELVAVHKAELGHLCGRQGPCL